MSEQSPHTSQPTGELHTAQLHLFIGAQIEQERVAERQALAASVLQAVNPEEVDKKIRLRNPLSSEREQATRDALLLIQNPEAALPEHLHVKRDWSDNLVEHTEKQQEKTAAAVKILETRIAAHERLTASRQRRAEQRRLTENGEVQNATFEIDVATAEQAKRGEDRILRDDKHRIYAVIDGMGGHGDGDVAAVAVQEGISEFWSNLDVKVTPENAAILMKQAFTLGQKRMIDAALEGKGNTQMGAVASAMHLFENEDGSYGAVIGHVGDTRAIVQYGQGTAVESLTQDECVGNVVLNAITLHPEHPMKLEQFSVIPRIKNNTRFALVSDGITGDRPEQFLTPEEYQQAFDLNPEQATADELIRLSKKSDDKSAIVIDVSLAIGESDSANTEDDTFFEEAPKIDESNESEVVLMQDRPKQLMGWAAKQLKKLRNAPIAAAAKLHTGLLSSREYFTDEEKGRRRKITGVVLGGIAVAGIAYLETRGHSVTHHAAENHGSSGVNPTDATPGRGPSSTGGVEAPTTGGNGSAAAHHNQPSHTGAGAHTEHHKPVHTVKLHHGQTVSDIAYKQLRAEHLPVDQQHILQRTQHILDINNHMSWDEARRLADETELKV